MDDLRTLVREQMNRAGSPAFSLHDLDRRRERRLRNQRISAGVIGVAVFALFLAAVSVAMSTEGTDEPGIDGPSIAPVPAPSSAGNELQPNQLGLEKGRYWLDVGQMRVSLAVPRGWDVWVAGGGIIDSRHRGWPPGTGIGFYKVAYVYADPCHWARGKMPIGPTAADLAAALARQPDRAATTPTDVELDGFHGKMVRLHVPSDVDFSECSVPDFGSVGAEFRSWPGRFHQGAEQVDEVWILDVEGERLVIDAWWFPKTSADERERVIDIVESIRIHPAPAS